MECFFCKMYMRTKILSLTFYFVTVLAVLANAQETSEKKDNYPAWAISKDVKRLQFKNITFVPATITLGDVASVASKDVQKKNSEKRSGYVAMNGYPTWTISKGVARQQAERDAKK